MRDSDLLTSKSRSSMAIQEIRRAPCSPGFALSSARLSMFHDARRRDSRAMKPKPRGLLRCNQVVPRLFCSSNSTPLRESEFRSLILPYCSLTSEEGGCCRHEPGPPSSVKPRPASNASGTACGAERSGAEQCSAGKQGPQRGSRDFPLSTFHVRLLEWMTTSSDVMSGECIRGRTCHVRSGNRHNRATWLINNGFFLKGRSPKRCP